MKIRTLCLSVLMLVYTSEARAFLPGEPFLMSAIQPMSELDYQEVLKNGSFEELQAACVDASRFFLKNRLRVLRDVLLNENPEDISFEESIIQVNALMSCKDPESANTILKSLFPSNESQKKILLLLSWKAANAALDHENASLSIRRLVKGNLSALDEEQFTIGLTDDGSPIKRCALDLLADHEYSLGFIYRAVMVLLSGRFEGLLGSKRIDLIEEWIQGIEVEQYNQLFEPAIDQAISRNAWDSAEKIIRLQLKLTSETTLSTQKLKEKLEKIIMERQKSSLNLIEYYDKKESKFWRKRISVSVS